MYAVHSVGPIKKKPQLYGWDHWCIQKGIQIRCFDFLRDVLPNGQKNGANIMFLMAYITLL